MNEVEKYWIERYQQDKIGTIAALSQAMQHMAWLREWKRIHGDSPRIKPITKKVNGEKVKVGEADIAVPWSKLDEFFKKGNEYGDVETVKFLMERIEQGDVRTLSEEELLELAEKENVKWSDGKHSLNPLQGYLYDFVKKGNSILDPLPEKDYGSFLPAKEYMSEEKVEDAHENTREEDAKKAFSRYYTTRLIQDILSRNPDSKYSDFANYDITSATEPEQIEELDRKLAEMMSSPEIQEEMQKLEGNAEYEKRFYSRLKNEVDVEIKKDTDRIQNAHKIFVALETGNLQELFEDKETKGLAEAEYEKEFQKKQTTEGAEVSPRDIAEAAKEEGLTTRENEGEGIIKFVKGLLKKVKDIFRSEGER